MTFSKLPARRGNNSKYYRKVCEKNDGVEIFIKDKTKEIWSHEKLPAEEVIYSVVSFFIVYVSRKNFLSFKIVSLYGI